MNVTVAAASGATTHNLLSATHPDSVAAAPVLGDLIAANRTPAWARLAWNTTATRKFLRQTGTGTVSAAPAWDTLLAGDLPTHTHAESDVTSLATDLTSRPVKGGAWAVSKAAVINSSGQLDGAAGTATDCVLVNGSSTAKANAAHTHAATDIVSGTLDNARTSGTANATASTLVLRDGSGGASFSYVAADNQWAYLDSHLQSLESGAFQTVGGPFENMAKYSEDFTVATWDKNGGSCSVTGNSTAAPEDLLIIDEFGFDRIECPQAAHLLYKIIAMRNQKRSTALVTNVDFEKWVEYMTDGPLAMAFLDRVAEGAILLEVMDRANKHKGAESAG